QRRLDHVGRGATDRRGPFLDAETRSEVVHHLVELGRQTVRHERHVDHCFDRLGQPGAATAGHRTAKRGKKILAAAIDDGARERRLVRKVLVQRAEADASSLGGARGGELVVAVLEQNLSGRLDNRLDSDFGASLTRSFPWLYIHLERLTVRARKANSQREEFDRYWQLAFKSRITSTRRSSRDECEHVSQVDSLSGVGGAR